MQVNIKLFNTATGDPIKWATLKVPDKSTRMSMVILAKKWAALSGVKSMTQPVDINTFVIHVPTAWQKIEVEVDRLDATYADQLVQKENKGYVWYVPEFSYRTKDNKQTLKGVWR